MAAKIQISRGNIKNKTDWLEGELFWVPRSPGNPNNSDYDPSYSKDKFQTWDEGTLYIGRPSLDEYQRYEKPIAIGGNKAVNSLTYRGLLTNEKEITEGQFKHCRTGDFWFWNNDATGGSFKLKDDFRRGDLLIITDPGELNYNGTIKNQSKIRYFRQNGSGGQSKDVYFTRTATENYQDFKADNVRDALLELQAEKLEYITNLENQSQVPINPIIGGLYFISAEYLNISPVKNGGSYEVERGDFIFWWKNPSTNEKYWIVIPSGYGHARLINYYDSKNLAEKNQYLNSLFKTFENSHVQEFSNNSHDVHSTLDFLMANKAGLDSQGKIPLSLLHDTVLGGLQFRGKWNPIKNNQIDGIYLQPIQNGSGFEVTDSSKLNPLPGWSAVEDGDSDPSTGLGTYRPAPGDYYIVELPDNVGNLYYRDPLTAQFVEEFSTGDWIIYIPNQNDNPVGDNVSAGSSSKVLAGWIKLDNTERLSGLTFGINSSKDNNNYHVFPYQLYEIDLTGNPKISASGKIGLIEQSGTGTEIEIVGRNLVDQRVGEDGIELYHPRYTNFSDKLYSIEEDNLNLLKEYRIRNRDLQLFYQNTVVGHSLNLILNTKNTIENSFVEDIVKLDGTENINNTISDNITRVHANLEVGKYNYEWRDESVYGNLYIRPHLDTSFGFGNNEKGFLDFEVLVGQEFRNVKIYAPNGKTEEFGGINEDIVDKEVVLVLPEHTSTLIGKLPPIEFISKRITKSVVEGYIESSSIEEHILQPDAGYNEYDHRLNIVEIHSNLQVGHELKEWRDSTVYGNFYIEPHPLSELYSFHEENELELLDPKNYRIENTNLILTEPLEVIGKQLQIEDPEKGYIQFKVNVKDSSQPHLLRIYAPNGKNKSFNGIEEDTIDCLTNIVLPEHTSTVVGKLPGIEFINKRMMKSIVEGYIESSSIEEHINDQNGQYDSSKNVVEFHSQVSTPTTNTYEINFSENYEENKFVENQGTINPNQPLAHLVINPHQQEPKIELELPYYSGTLITYEDLPLRRYANAVKTRLSDNFGLTNNQLIELLKLSYSKSLEFDNYQPTLYFKEADSVLITDLLIGQFDSNGHLLEGHSLIATKAIGISDGQHPEGFINPPRTNFPGATVYRDPITYEKTEKIPVEVDLPNESGVLLTHQSIIDGGCYYGTETKQTYQIEAKIA